MQRDAARHDAALEGHEREEHERGDVVDVGVGRVLGCPHHEEAVLVHVDGAVGVRVHDGEHVAQRVSPGARRLELSLAEPEGVLPHEVVHERPVLPELLGDPPAVLVEHARVSGARPEPLGADDVQSVVGIDEKRVHR